MVTAVAAVIVDFDGVGNISVVVISVVNLGKLLIVTSDVALDIGSAFVLATIVNGCTEAESVCVDDNSGKEPSMEIWDLRVCY